MSKLKINVLLHYFLSFLICLALFTLFYHIGTKLQLGNTLADTRDVSGDLWADKIFGQFDFSQGATRATTAFKVGNPGGTWVDRSQSPNVLYVSDSLNSRILGYTSLGICTSNVTESHRDGNAYCDNHGGIALTNPDSVTSWSQCLAWCDTLMNGTDLPICQWNGDTDNCWINHAPGYEEGVSNGDVNTCDWWDGVPPYGAWWSGFEAGEIACTTDNDCSVGETCTITPTLHCANTQVACTTDSDCIGQSVGNTTCVPINADIVIGQPDFVHSACNGDVSYSNGQFPTPSNSSLCSLPPIQISPLEGGFFASFTTDSQSRLYFPDWINNRVLMYSNPALQVGSVVATSVWGQVDYASHDCNKGGSPSSTSICFGNDDSGNPTFNIGVDVDSSGNLWVADTLNNRVLRFPYDIGTGKPLGTADIVLGQQAFSTNGSGNGFNELKYPGAVRVATDGTVFVADTYNHRIIKYAGAITTGMSGVEWGSGFGSAGSSDSPGPTGIEFEVNTAGALTGNIWISNYNGGNGENRIELWNAAGDTVIKVLYSDVYPNTVQGGINCGSDITPLPGNLCYQGDSRGSIGITDQGDLFITSSSNNQQVLRFKAPIATSVEGGPYTAADFKLYQEPDEPNWLTSSSMYGPSGLAIYNGTTTQLIVGDGYRLLFWNNPLDAENGSEPNGIIGAANGQEKNANAYGRIATDDDDHLYVLHKSVNPTIEIFNLPLTNGESPAQTIDASTLQDLEGQTINLSISGDLAIGGLFANSDGNYLWVAHPGSNRVVRIKDPMIDPKVDIVLGQTASNATACNRGTTMSDTTLCSPGSVVLDKNENIYVSDGSLEINGNGRLVEYDNSNLTALVNLSGGTETVYGPSLDKTIIADGHFPFSPAFDSNNRMVVGYNSYSGFPNSKHSLDYFSNALLNQNPSGSFEDYWVMPYSLVFDSNDNLFVSDINRTKVMVYESPMQNIVVETPTPEPTQEPTTTPVPDNNNSNNNSNNTDPGGSGSTCNAVSPGGAPDLFEIRVAGKMAALFFKPPQAPYDSMYIAYSTRPDIWEYGTEYSQGFSGGVLKYDIRYLKPNTRYYFKVRAGNGCTSGAWSNTMVVTTINTELRTKNYYKSLISSFIQTSKYLANTLKPSIKVKQTPSPNTLQNSNITPTPKPSSASKKFCILWWCF